MWLLRTTHIHSSLPPCLALSLCAAPILRSRSLSLLQKLAVVDLNISLRAQPSLSQSMGIARVGWLPLPPAPLPLYLPLFHALPASPCISFAQSDIKNSPSLLHVMMLPQFRIVARFAKPLHTHTHSHTHTHTLTSWHSFRVCRRVRVLDLDSGSGSCLHSAVPLFNSVLVFCILRLGGCAWFVDRHSPPLPRWLPAPACLAVFYVLFWLYKFYFVVVLVAHHR